MVDGNPPLRKDLLQVAVGDGVAEVEEHRVQDHLFRIVHALELDHVARLSLTL